MKNEEMVTVRVPARYRGFSFFVATSCSTKWHPQDVGCVEVEVEWPDEPEKPLPCPFCGTEPHVVAKCASTPPQWRVECRKASCAVVPSSGRCRTLCEAVQVWNRRAPREGGA